MESRVGADWAYADPNTKESRITRLERELRVIEKLGFASYFLILADIMDHCREVGIVYGPGRGSVGGCYAAFALGIHEVDSLEHDLLFERFLDEGRATWPDIDLDFSQRDRQKVLDYIREEIGGNGMTVLQVAAFARAGARSVVDMVAAAKSDTQDDAFEIAEIIRKKIPDGTKMTGGAKADDGEFHYCWRIPTEEEDWATYIERNPEEYKSWAPWKRELWAEVERWGWLDDIRVLDGIQTHLAKHAAGVVLLAESDLGRLPQCGSEDSTAKEWRVLTGYDMYSLEALDYLKYDILGLRTLDLLGDAHKYTGGGGSTEDLMRVWRETSRPGEEDQATIELFQKADTLGVFQVETAGFRHLLKEFQPETFEHIVQMNALYRPGALDFQRADGLNMVEVFTRRKNKVEGVHYDFVELTNAVKPILAETQGIILYQEQSMKIARDVCDFTPKESDELRKAIGKKRRDLMDKFKGQFIGALTGKGWQQQAAESLWGNIEAAARYSWNKSHSVEYGILTWLCGYFKANHPEAFYTAYINSWSSDAERQAEGIGEARQRCKIAPPDINIAQADYTVADGAIVFGLNGIKGIGESNRTEIIGEREVYGPYLDFTDFHRRLPSVPINMKTSLIQCGAFDRTDHREYLLGVVERAPDKDGNPRYWTVAEFLKHNAGLKKPRPVPGPLEVQMPTPQELAEAELETIGFYVSNDPMSDVTQALARLDHSIHWGGTIESVRFKIDRNGGNMAMVTMLGNDLNKKRLVIFSSVLPRCRPMLEKGLRVIVRGRSDGGSILVDGMFTPGDYRHIQKIRSKRGEEPPRLEAYRGNGQIAQYESEGYAVELI